MTTSGEQKLSLCKRCRPIVIRGLALLVLVASGSVIYGWETQQRSLIQILPHMAPMQFNTALCFMLCSLALFFKTLQWKIPTSLSALTAFGLSSLTLFQYLLETNYGIDQFFAHDFIQTKTSHPGRMPPLTAVCFVLYSIALIPKRKHWALGVGVTFTVILISSISLIAALVGSDGIFGWGTFQRMALHTSISLLILGGAFLCLKLSDKSKSNIDLWHTLPVSTFIASITITLVAWFSLYEATSMNNRAYFQSLVKDTTQALLERYMLYEHALVGGVGVYYASDYVSLKEWRAYVNALQIDETLPGINGIGYIDYVNEGDLDRYLKQVSTDEIEGFTNQPNTAFDDKFIIKYIEPVDHNIRAIGLDIGFEPNRRHAAERARDTGKPSLTHKIDLVQDTNKTAGFLLLVPVYETRNTPDTIESRRKNIKGWVYAPFMAPSFFQGLTAISNNQIDFTVYDGAGMTYENLIFSRELQEDYTPHDHPYHEKVTQIDIAGKTWSVEWHANDNFAPTSHNFGVVIALGGLAFSLMLYFLLNTVISSRERTANEVRKRTKELADAVRFLTLIGENIPDMLFVKDSLFRVVQGNKKFFALYPEEEREDIIGTTTIEHFNEAEAERFLEHDKLALKDGYIQYQENITFPNGDKRLLLTTKIRFENEDGEQFILGLARDITKEKEAEEKILSANEELRRSNAELERFAYIASHDLQEPLRKIGGFTTLIGEKLEGKLDEESTLYMGFVKDGVERMHELIKGLLAYSRINSDTLETQQFDTNGIVADAVNNLSEIIKDNNAKIKYNNLPSIYHDKVMLTQLFQNLISNAIKYRSDKDPVITITANDCGEHWEFAVKDNGMGMESRHLEKIFEMFQRLHRKEDISGTGIGLSLCQKIVERYNGKIWAVSKPEKGSTFFFTIPKNMKNNEKQ